MLALFAILPVLAWNGDPSTAQDLQRQGVKQIAVADPAQWKDVGKDGVTAVRLPAEAVKLPAPGSRRRGAVSGATEAPWVEAPGWHFVRDPNKPYLYENVPAARLALAASEAFANGGEQVYIQPEAAADCSGYVKAVEFLQSVAKAPQPPLANIDVVDDGSPQLGEIINLLARRNLLFRLTSQPEKGYDLTVKLSETKYPKQISNNPSAFAQQIRYELTDERRLLRIYGSEVVLGRLTGDGAHPRLHLLNYGNGPIAGLRIKIRGQYRPAKVAALSQPDLALQDVLQNRESVEFTVPQLVTYAVIDLDQVKN